MTAPTPPLIDLAHAYGISTEFTDWRGRTALVSQETIERVLVSLGADPSDPVRALYERWQQPWRRTLPACTVAVAGEGRWCWVHVPHGAPVTAAVVLEHGGERPLAQVEHWVEPRDVDGVLTGEATFHIPGDLPDGYHTLVASCGGETSTAPLIVTPPWLGLPERFGNRVGWGLSAQLYSVRSERSWGVGDLTDLADLAVWAGADLGADFVLVNPLHAAEPVPPLEPSPYLPSSRRFFSPLYLRVEAIGEFSELAPAAAARIRAIGDRLRTTLADVDAIDRDAAWSAKLDALRLVYGAPRSAGRELDLQAYRRRQGDALIRFATWSVLAVEFGNDARTWPDRYRDAASVDVAVYAAAHEDDIDFTCWLQWVLDEQLGHAQERAVNAGMGLGTMHDLAVGVHPGGADAWRLADTYAAGMQVGAPPDPFNQLGQNWQQPPWQPDRLAELGYAPFRDMIRAVLRHAGGVRVDHIIGLFRLWWVPVGARADAGAYVYYDHEALIGVLVLEAQRAGAVVVGEDLGVVDPNARAYFASRGILGTSILWFEGDGVGGALPAERWREWCLASVTTHDLPPTAGYLAGDHVRLRHALGLLPGDLDSELAADAHERDVWLGELRDRGLLAAASDVEDTVLALHRFLAQTPARLIGVALTDAVGDRRTQNQPGTIDEYPNWRVPLADPTGAPLLLEQVLESARARRLAAVLRR